MPVTKNEQKLLIKARKVERLQNLLEDYKGLVCSLKSIQNAHGVGIIIEGEEPFYINDSKADKIIESTNNKLWADINDVEIKIKAIVKAHL